MYVSIKPNIEILDADKNLQKRSLDSSGRLKTRGKHAGRVSWQNAKDFESAFQCYSKHVSPVVNAYR